LEKLKLEIDEDDIENIRFLCRSLVFNGGKGLSIKKLHQIFQDDYPNILKNTKRVFNLLGIDLRLNEDDNKMFIVPNREFYNQVEILNLSQNFKTISKDQKEFLARFLSLYLSEGKYEPIFKDKIKRELFDKFAIEYREKELRNLEELGYINIIKNKFIDIGWRLKDSPEFQRFTEEFLKIIEEREDENTNVKR